MYTKYKTEIRSITPKKTVVNNSNNSHITNILDRCRAVDFDGDVAYFCSDLEKSSPELKESVRQLKERQAVVKVQVSAVPEGQASRLGTVQNRFIVRKKDLLPFISAQPEISAKAEIAPELEFDKPKVIEPVVENVQSSDTPLITAEEIEEIQKITSQWLKVRTPAEKVKKSITDLLATQGRLDFAEIEKQRRKDMNEDKCRMRAYFKLYSNFDGIMEERLKAEGKTLESVGLIKPPKDSKGRSISPYINVIMDKGYIVVLQDLANKLFPEAAACVNK